MSINTLNQSDLFSKDELLTQEQYWREKLQGDILMGGFPQDFQSTISGNYHISTISFKLPGELCDTLNRIGNNNLNAIYLILLSGVTYLLDRYTFNSDIIVGTPVLKGNPHAQLTGNIVLIRQIIDSESSYKDFLMQLKQTVSEAEKNSSYPFSKIAEMLGLPAGTAPKIMCMLKNIHDRSFISDTNYDTLISFEWDNGQITINIDYNSCIYKQETVKRICSQLERFYSCITKNVNIKLLDIEILSDEERNKLLFDFNDTYSEPYGAFAISKLFEEQASKTPDNIALSYNGTYMTYRELNEEANKLARMLRKKGICECSYDKGVLPEKSVVALIMDRSFEMIVSIMGVLKAGAAYLPIDPAYPTDRVIKILDDASIKFIISKNSVINKLSYTLLQNIGQIHTDINVTAKREQIKDLDNHPYPDRSLIDYSKYSNTIGMAHVKNSILIQGSRGCPYNCAYCHKIWPKTHITRSAKNIFEEVKHYYDLGVRKFAIIDDIFNLNVQNSSEFLNMIIDNKMDLQLFFANGLRGDILTEEYVDLMVRAGAVNISLALETASPRLQKLIGKNLNIDKLKHILNYITTKHPQVILDLFLMIGFPTETEEEAQMTIDFVKDIKWLHFPVLSILKIYPNTDMEKLALESGISKEAIMKSADIAYHELPETLPFSKHFARKIQAGFLNDYFLSKERLKSVTDIQRAVMSEDELLQKYNSYLPDRVNSIADVMKMAGINEYIDCPTPVKEDKPFYIPGPSSSVRSEDSEDRLKILFLDLSQYFTGENSMLYDVAEPPLGLMYLLTYLNKHFGDRIEGKILKSRFDFNSYDELYNIIGDLKPDIIGIRSLTFYKDFFHKTVSLIRQWGFSGAIVTGGPYATSDYQFVLADKNVDIAILGEGELTWHQLTTDMLKNGKKLPDYNSLKDINGIAFAKKCEKANKEQNSGLSCEIFLLDELSNILARESTENIEISDDPSRIAYIMYTSGSSGIPKGTLISNCSINRIVKNTNYISLSPRDSVLQLSNYAFDGSVFDIFGSLVNGAKLVLADSDTFLDMVKLARIIKEEKVNMFFVTTAMFNALIDINHVCLANIDRVLFGGERVSMEHAVKALKVMGKNKILHMYGPTENTVFTTFYSVNEVSEGAVTIPIGKPITGTKIYIMDRNNRLQPIGALGELCISGSGLAKGYLNDLRLTKEKFVDNPFVHGETLYKTGDLVRYLDDGNIEYIDRLDSQVKLRGFRIELGEIENCILKHQCIKEAVVICREGDGENRHICAYLVAEDNLEEVDVKEYLSKSLPDFMIPTYIIKMERLPLNSNGKIDKRNLPNPETTCNVELENAEAENEIELKLLELWKEELELERISIHDNFFDLGGHSLKAAILVSRINSEFGIELPLSEIFRNTTIKELAEDIGRMIQEGENEDEKCEATYNTMKYGENITLLKEGKAKDKNIFFIHDGSGEVAGYIEFCKNLENDFNCWGIKAKKLCGYSPENLEVADIADTYVSEIMSIQLEGPYYIGGWSLGGVIAFEIAKRFEKQNQEVRMLALFDSDSDVHAEDTTITHFDVETEKQFIKEILHEHKLDESIKSINDLDSIWSFVLDYFEKDNRTGDFINKLEAYLPDVLKPVIPYYAYTDIRELTQRLNTIRTLIKAQKSFKEGDKLKAQTYFFKASENSNLGWSIWEVHCENSLKLYSFSGDHYSMFKMPEVIKNSRLFDELLSEIALP